MLLDRSRHRPVRHFRWRVRLLGLGAVLAVVGMYVDAAWIINLAIIVLAAGILLRFVPARDDRDGITGHGSSEEDGEPGA